MFILFLIVPFIAFLYSIKNLEKKEYAIVFVLFYGLFGYCQDFSLTTSDIHRLGGLYVGTKDMDILQLYLSGGLTDIYLMGTTILMRQFTANPKIFFALLGLIFGFLTYMCAKPIYKYWEGKKNYAFYIVIFVFLSNISLVHFTGLRFFTAGLFFCACLIRYIIYQRKRYLFLTPLTILIHFGFLPVVGAVLLYFFFLKCFFKKQPLMKKILILSFILSFIPLKSVTSGVVSEMDGSAIQGKFASYTKDDQNNGKQENASLYREANDLFTTVCGYIRRIGAFFFLLALLKEDLSSRKYPGFFNRLFSFTIFIFSLSFVSSAAISDGSRLVSIAWVFALFMFSIYLSRNLTHKWIKWDKTLIFINFYSIAFLFINAPRLVTPLIWIMNVPFIIYSGIDFKMPI